MIRSTGRWVIAAVAVTLLIYTYVSPYFLTSVVVGKVTGKQGDAGQGNYIVFVKDANEQLESLANYDTWRRLKFNSTDIQGGVEIGTIYEFHVLGHRNPFFSEYRNIIAFEKVPQ